MSLELTTANVLTFTVLGILILVGLGVGAFLTAGLFNARAVNVALTGRNLHTWTKVPNIDPEFSYTIGNFQGFEFGALPNARSIGLSFRVTP